MEQDKRLDNIITQPSGEVAITKKQQIEVIYKAIDQVLDGDGHIVRRMPFNEDYRTHQTEE